MRLSPSDSLTAARSWQARASIALNRDRERGRRRSGQLGLVQAGPGAAPHQREEAPVVLVARPLGRVHRVGVAAVENGHLGHHPPERGVPLHRVVSTGLPGVDQHRLAGAVGVARAEKEAVPGVKGRDQGASAPLVRMALEHKPHAGGGPPAAA